MSTRNGAPAAGLLVSRVPGWLRVWRRTWTYQSQRQGNGALMMMMARDCVVR